MTRLKSPLEPVPVTDDEIPFLHECYVYTAEDCSDPTMVWGSRVDMSNLQNFIRQRNETTNILLSPTTILVRAVGLALQKHPSANCRLLGSRIYRFTERNVTLPLQTRSGAELVLLRNIDSRSYEQIATELQEKVTQEITQTRRQNFRQKFTRRFPHFLRAVGVRFLIWLTNSIRMPTTRFTELLVEAPVMVNYFGFRCAPPLTSYKASRFNSRSILLNITLGPTSPEPVIAGDEIVIRPISGLFVRADHRTIDARLLAAFTRTLIEILEDPQQFDLKPAEREKSPDA